MANENQNSIMIPELAMRLESIFMPYARGKRDALYTNKDSARFVHYTSAEAALSIIKNKRIWMRNTTCMSDYSEVQHGYGILNEFFKDPSKKAEFTASLDECSPNIATEAIDLFNQWWQDIQLNTYVASIAEHDDKEDLHGRLSMWRAFGGNTARVAMIFSVPRVAVGARALNLLFSPVAYFQQEEVHAELYKVIENIRANCDFLRSIERRFVVGTVLATLVAGVTCLKHEGFHEEREWRVIYLPKQIPSPLIEHSTEIIGGVPQIVYKLPLDMRVSSDLADLDIARLFDSLIIGPSPYLLYLST